jgi:hypothetical protein
MQRFWQFFSQTENKMKWTPLRISLIAIAILAGIGVFAFGQEFRIHQDKSRGEHVLLNSNTEIEYTNKVHNYKIRYPTNYELINSKDGAYNYNPNQSTKESFSEGDIILIERQEKNWAQYTISVPPIKNSKPFQENLSTIREGIKSLAGQHDISVVEKEITVGNDSTRGTEFSFNGSVPGLNDNNQALFAMTVFEYNGIIFLVSYDIPENEKNKTYMNTYKNLLDSITFF